MILEMRRALADLKSHNRQGYRKLFDATYEEVYCRSLVVVQQEEQAVELTKDFFGELFGAVEEAQDAADQEKWFWQKYYQKMRKQYHKLLKTQETPASGAKRTLADLPASFPLLHRVMLVMHFEDDFTAAEISGIFGLEEDKIQLELEKLGRALPSLTKDQPESAARYLGNWKALFSGAFRQIVNACSDNWVDQAYAGAAEAAGVAAESAGKKNDAFEYFVADVDLSPEKPGKKAAPLVEEDEEADSDGEEEAAENDEGDDRYDWDLEDDGKRMIILGVVIALVIVIIVGVAALKLLNKNKGESKTTPSKTEESVGEDQEAPLIVKGDDAGEPEAPVETPVEAPVEEPVEAPQEEEPPTAVVMQVLPPSMRLRSEPNTTSEVVGSLKGGEKVEVLSDLSEDWVQIRCTEQNNKEGYVKSENLKEVN